MKPINTIRQLRPSANRPCQELVLHEEEDIGYHHSYPGKGRSWGRRPYLI